MKSKNLILGVAAVVFAVGTAFATASVSLVDAFVITKATQFSEFECQNAGVQCDNSGTQTCTIRVNTSINSGTKTIQAHPSTLCTTELKNTTATTVVSSLSVYDAESNF